MLRVQRQTMNVRQARKWMRELKGRRGPYVRRVVVRMEMVAVVSLFTLLRKSARRKYGP